MKKNQNKSRVNRYFYRGSGFIVFIIILLAVTAAAAAALSFFSTDLRLGIGHIGVNSSAGQSAYVNVLNTDTLAFATETETGAVICLYPTRYGSYVFTVSREYYDNHFAPETAQTEYVTLYGRVLDIGAQFREVIEGSDVISQYKDNIGTVYLDTSYEITSPYRIPLIEGAMGALVLIIFIVIAISISRYKLLYSIALSLDIDKGYEMLGEELTSPYNVFINNNILLTESFCLIRNKRKAIYVPDVDEVTLREHTCGKKKKISETLYVQIPDGKRVKVITSSCRYGKSTAHYLYTVLREKIDNK